MSLAVHAAAPAGARPQGEARLPARPPADAVEWALVMLLLYNVVFVTPFIFKMFFWELNLALRVLTFGVTLLVIARRRFDLQLAARPLAHPGVFLFVLFYLAYLLVLTLATLLSYKLFPNWITGQPYNGLPQLINAWLLAFFGFAFVVYFDLALFRWVLDRFVDLMLICSISAVLLIPLLYFELLEPLTEIAVVPEGADAQAGRGAYYAFYGLGFNRDYVSVFGLRLPRAQSFSIEAAGFAYPLLAALIWAAHRGRVKAVLAMSTALTLAWSLGAFIFCLLIPLFQLLRRPLHGGLLLLGGATVFGVLVASGLIHADQFVDYLDEKFGNPQTSLGGRFTDIADVMELVLDGQWLGFGAGANLFVTPLTVTTSILAPLANAGIPGFLLWQCAYGLLGIQALRAVLFGDAEQRAIGLIVLSVFFVSLQAAGLDIGLLNWCFVALGLAALFARPLAPRASPSPPSASWGP